VFGILRIAYKLLVNDKGKFAALLTGITFAVFLMIQMTSMFAGMMKKASLRALEHDAETLRAQTDSVEAAEAALKLLQMNYQAGIATYLQVLVADGQFLQAKLGYVQAVAQRLEDTVALSVALGGGWKEPVASSK
jgi:hypothetical protein